MPPVTADTATRQPALPDAAAVKATKVSQPGSQPDRRKRGEGQWALGYHEPLNKNEENKKSDDGLNVRQRIIDIYSKCGFDSIDPADLRGRFRWYGLYTQRRPGIDGRVSCGIFPFKVIKALRLAEDAADRTLDPAKAIARKLRRRADIVQPLLNMKSPCPL